MIDKGRERPRLPGIYLPLELHTAENFFWGGEGHRIERVIVSVVSSFSSS